jgi:hypothetical protein
MGRLIEVQDVRTCPSQMTVRLGDVLLFHAVGGRVRSGRETVRLLGVFFSSVLGNNGQILTPIGPPNIVMFQAHQPGPSLIDVITGDPFQAPRTTTVYLTVEP